MTTLRLLFYLLTIVGATLLAGRFTLVKHRWARLFAVLMVAISINACALAVLAFTGNHLNHEPQWMSVVLTIDAAILAVVVWYIALTHPGRNGRSIWSKKS